MYKLRGADGKEYGPVSADTLRDWVNQGRANGQTLVLPEGTTDWKPLSTLGEFATLVSAPRSAPAALPSGAPRSEGKTSGLAVGSLVLGCTGFLTCGVTSLVGLPLGIVAMIKVKNSQGRLSGWGLALAGTIISGATFLLIPVFAAMLLPALAKAKSKAQSINCVNNVKQLGLAVRIYASDNNDTFPAATNWCDMLLTDVGSPKVFVCPAAPNAQSGYAFNAKLSGIDERTINPQTVLIFESDSGWNATGGKELMISQPRHNGRFIVGFADGSVQQLTPAEVGQLRWDPQPASATNQNSD